MKIKKKRLSVLRYSILSAILIVFHTCMDDSIIHQEEGEKDSSGLIFGKNKELTQNTAKKWYQLTQKPVMRMASTANDSADGILVMPSWNHAKEWKKGKYEVVEASLKSQNNIMFFDNETWHRVDSGTANLEKIKNVGRMIFLKNMETGEIINFNMVIIGSYDYLMKENNGLSKNTYLQSLILMELFYFIILMESLRMVGSIKMEK